MQKAKKASPQNGEKWEELTLPRDLAWNNWAKFEEAGDSVIGEVVDVFYRQAEGEFKEQRGLTLKQEDGELINVAIKRIPFILTKTDNVRLGDLLKITFEKELPPRQKGHKGAKQFGYAVKRSPGAENNKTIRELEKEDMDRGGTTSGEHEEPANVAGKGGVGVPQEEF